MNKGKIVFGVGGLSIAIYGIIISYIGWSGGGVNPGTINNLLIFLGHFTFFLTIFFSALLFGLSLSKEGK